MADGMPDARIFKYRVGQIIAAAGLTRSNGKPRNVRMFGEMVSFLYRPITCGSYASGGILDRHNSRPFHFSFCAYSLKLESIIYRNAS